MRPKADRWFEKWSLKSDGATPFKVNGCRLHKAWIKCRQTVNVSFVDHLLVSSASFQNSNGDGYKQPFLSNKWTETIQESRSNWVPTICRIKMYIINHVFRVLQSQLFGQWSLQENIIMLQLLVCYTSSYDIMLWFHVFFLLHFHRELVQPYLPGFLCTFLVAFSQKAEWNRPQSIDFYAKKGRSNPTCM